GRLMLVESGFSRTIGFVVYGLGRTLRRRDQKAAPASVRFAHDLEACGRVLRAFHDNVLEHIAEIRFDRALVARFDFEVVGDRTALVDLAVGLRQDGARRVTVSGARGLELLERFQPRLEAGQLVLARSDRTRAPLVLDARARQLRLTARPANARRFDGVV